MLLQWINAEIYRSNILILHLRYSSISIINTLSYFWITSRVMHMKSLNMRSLRADGKSWSTVSQFCSHVIYIPHAYTSLLFFSLPF